MSPQRIQRKRVAGWRRPDNAVIVDRTSRWGNPFTLADCLDAEVADNEADARKVCVTAYDAWLDGDYAHVEPARRLRILAELHTLAGKDLACPCEPGLLCHGDVLIRRAARHNVGAVAS
ncbi:hypothetical protein GCM10011608_09440 [Micromonospora sonchi]|uniref:DUF4326 domain-containing protein n=1 Tax=Micromonospora sonchi TaxID=1763543 RepID=A0A917TKL9_9ACTN|nr:DUF4326 domain-containing protein [Micromonospora sonchi]GGM26751.1 hypothetical protein GCM10011608_09440 [Micromonospora sonchi]